MGFFGAFFFLAGFFTAFLEAGAGAFFTAFFAAFAGAFFLAAFFFTAKGSSPSCTSVSMLDQGSVRQIGMESNKYSHAPERGSNCPFRTLRTHWG